MAVLTYNRTIFTRLDNYPMQVAIRMVAGLASEADALADDVRRSHVWQNRTGRLENSIKGYIKQEGTKVIIGVGYDSSAVSVSGFPYGAKLEQGYGGAYASLRPALLRGEATILDKAKQIAGGKI